MYRCCERRRVAESDGTQADCAAGEVAGGHEFIGEDPGFHPTAVEYQDQSMLGSPASICSSSAPPLW